MDGNRFDSLARSLAGASSRRQLLKGAFGAAVAGALGAIGVSGESRRVPDALAIEAAPSIDYFALGDSIASGHGLMDTGDGAGNLCPDRLDGVTCCRRSGSSYPYQLYYDRLLTRYSSGNFYHLACSGANTKHLAGQVDTVLASVTNRPTLVTITMSANDFGWSDVETFKKHLYFELLEGDFDTWANGVIATAKSRIKKQVKRLLEKPNVFVVITELYNPFNRDSVFFSYSLLPGRCGVVDCYARIDRAAGRVNDMLRQIESEINLPKQLRVTTGLNAAFSVNASATGYYPSGSRKYQEECGYDSDGASVGQTYIQAPTDKNSNSKPVIPKGIGWSKQWYGDCFHPNARGAKAIATKVDQALKRTSFPAVFPRFVKNPAVKAVDATSITVVWSTNQAADGVLEYGLTTNYDRSKRETGVPDTSHSVKITGLLPNTTYHLRARSTNDEGHAAVSGDLVATTVGCASGKTFCTDQCVDTATDRAHCGDCETVCDENESCVVGQCITGNQYRIVLTWGSAPNDLDSHLWLPEAQPFHIFFSQRGQADLFPFADLDHDDVTSFGPETVTIASVLDGTYAYAVYNYSNEYPLSSSGAVVQLYRGDNLLQTFTVPSGGWERWWYVFQLASDGTVTTVDELLSSSPGPYQEFSGTAMDEAVDDEASPRKGLPGADRDSDGPRAETPTPRPAPARTPTETPAPPTEAPTEEPTEAPPVPTDVPTEPTEAPPPAATETPSDGSD